MLKCREFIGGSPRSYGNVKPAAYGMRMLCYVIDLVGIELEDHIGHGKECTRAARNNITELICERSHKSRTRSTNGVIGSCSRLTTASISRSRTIKLVADVSLSISSTRLLAPSASIVPAACEVDPLASEVEKKRVSRLSGSSPTNSEILTECTARPSSTRSFTAESSVR